MSEEAIIDYDDPKVKHCSEQYMNMPSAPEPDDILYWCKSKKKKVFTTHDLIKVFGMDKLEQIDKTMEWLDFNNYTAVMEKNDWIDPKSVHWFYHGESDGYTRMTWEEFGKHCDASGEELNHIGLSKSENETEAKDLHKILQEGGDTEDGSITITKYELLKDGK